MELIEAYLANGTLTGHALLDELRWHVLRAEKKTIELTHALVNSVARTVRDGMPHLCRHKIDIRFIRAGIIARAALYRVPEWEAIERFLAAKNRAAICTFSVHDKEYGYWPDHRQFIPSPQKFRLSMGVDLEADGRQIAERIIFPLTSPLTIIGKSIPSDSDIDEVASVDWKIYLLSGREFGPSTLRAMLPTAPIDIHACQDEDPNKP